MLLPKSSDTTTNDSKLASLLESSWVSGPTSRVTLTVVFSCFITLFLCVWTAVQVNIEPENNRNSVFVAILGDKTI